MRNIENYCVGCETCAGYCRYKNDVEIISCDFCGSQEDIYEVNGNEICIDCLLKDDECISDFIYEYKNEYLNFIGANKIDG